MPTALTDLRHQSEKDCDHILYSSAFRRLGGVTQVVSVGEIPLFHNRLTHSMKVGQLAKRLADDLLRSSMCAAENLDADAAMAAGYAHDLGHPPFGHIAEDALSAKCDEIGIDGFEGNAQTFRILTKLSRRASPEPGLGLSPKVLNAVLKYPWLRPDEDPTLAGDSGYKHHRRKWGAYLSETADFETARQGDKSEGQSIEAAIMDWCDDLSYALHDIEDFYRAGLLPLDRVEFDKGWLLASAGADLGARPGFDPQELNAALEGLAPLLARAPYRGTDLDRQSLHQQTNTLLDRFFGAVKVDASGTHISIGPTVLHEVMMLKQLTWQYVVNSPTLATIQRGQALIISLLFDDIVDLLITQEHTPHRLPARLRRIHDLVKTEAAYTANLHTKERIAGRTAADYISSLTEHQATDLHRRLRGSSDSSVLETWVAW